MKKILLINSVLGYGSTGHIVLDIAKEYEQNGYEAKIAYGRKANDSEDAKRYGFRIGSDIDVYAHVLYTRLTDKHGLASIKATNNFLRWANEFKPDVLWLHNIHDYYINYELLFEWIKTRPEMEVKWTLHDCWAFTGHCSHFSYVKCDKWRDKCHDCPQLDQYPKSIIDNSQRNYERKKKAFLGVKNLALITPSNWLASLVKQSYLSDYPVEVHYNKVDTDIFRPTPSDFKMTHNIADKIMILGVANVWNERKGLNDFIELASRLSVTDVAKKYQIVLVGLEKSQIDYLRETAPNIIALPRTNNAIELAQIYTAADIFVNPSYEETFGLTTAEAQACGTYSIVYEGTACAEIVKKDNGEIVSQGTANLVEAIFRRDNFKET